jgi:hypothetical protein
MTGFLHEKMYVGFGLLDEMRGQSPDDSGKPKRNQLVEPPDLAIGMGVMLSPKVINFLLLGFPISLKPLKALVDSPNFSRYLAYHTRLLDPTIHQCIKFHGYLGHVLLEAVEPFSDGIPEPVELAFTDVFFSHSLIQSSRKHRHGKRGKL